jgi:hypothetical protein
VTINILDKRPDCMKSLLSMRVGLALAVLGFTTPVGSAQSEVMIGIAGPLMALRVGVPLGWSIRVWNSSDATYSVLYTINGEVERKLLPPRRRTNVGYVLAREIPTFRVASIKRVGRYDLRSQGSWVWPFKL